MSNALLKSKSTERRQWYSLINMRCERFEENKEEEERLFGTELFEPVLTPCE